MGVLTFYVAAAIIITLKSVSRLERLNLWLCVLAILINGAIGLLLSLINGGSFH